MREAEIDALKLNKDVLLLWMIDLSSHTLEEWGWSEA